MLGATPASHAKLQIDLVRSPSGEIAGGCAHLVTILLVDDVEQGPVAQLLAAEAEQLLQRGVEPPHAAVESDDREEVRREIPEAVLRLRSPSGALVPAIL